MRGLSREFMADLKLKNGVLFPILAAVQSDPGLCLQIRNDCINVYYRGGSITKIVRKDEHLYRPSFNKKYLTVQSMRVLDMIPGVLRSQYDSRIWVSALPSLKHAMDLWFKKHPKDEREFQQLLVRENNFGKCARKTDYFICDIEYANANGRFDLIAAYWPSKGSERKKNDNIGLAFFEIKYGDGALAGGAGLKGHIKKMNDFLVNPQKLTSIKEEMKAVFNQMQELKLINVGKKIALFNNKNPEFILVLANHDPDSRILQRELGNIMSEALENARFDLKFAVSNFVGYGLYKQNIYGLDAFLDRFREQI